MKKSILILIILIVSIQCRKTETKEKTVEKTHVLIAENATDPLGGYIRMVVYDSTYTFEAVSKSPNHDKIEKFNGSCFIKKDTIYFSPFEFDYVESEKAVIKNNFVEFIGGDYPLKIGIKKTSLQLTPKLDLRKYPDYAVFTFDPEFYSYFPKGTKPFDLEQDELVEVDRILNLCFKENSSELTYDSSEYTKQCISVINLKNEKEVIVYCNCKMMSFHKESFKYYIFHVKDGGACHFSVNINLAKKSYSDLQINGEA